LGAQHAALEGRKEAAAARLCMLAKQHTDKKRRSFSQQQEFFFDGKSIQNLIFLKRILV
jgi:hypothetical protein